MESSDKSDLNFFKRDDVVVVMTTSPAGLGHLRVNDALIAGLPKNTLVEVLGSEDKRIQVLHRITSTHKVFREIMEFVQTNLFFEELFTRVYRKLLRRNAEDIFERLKTVIARRRPVPKILIIVSSHFGLAHQIAEIKQVIAKELNLCVILCVIDTDDSPQKIWAVNGADYIFVPSDYTKNTIASFFSGISNPPEIVSLPYPVSPNFDKLLSDEEFSDKGRQLSPNSDSKINLLIPISGAAVGLSYFKKLINFLDKSNLFNISVISRDSKYTKRFLDWCSKKKTVEVLADKFDQNVVEIYEKLFDKKVYSLEVSKPSEQAFKAIISPKRRGGVIMLFSEPVGRQEHDNLNFLLRHNLIPNKDMQGELNSLVFSKGINTDFKNRVLSESEKWRGVQVPKDGLKAGRFIIEMYKKGLFTRMLKFKRLEEDKEIGGSGVRKLWEVLAEDIEKKCYQLGIKK